MWPPPHKTTSEDKNVELRCNLQFSKFLVFGAELRTWGVHSDVSKNMFIFQLSSHTYELINFFPKIPKYVEK